jgi:hypothetical protein
MLRGVDGRRRRCATLAAVSAAAIIASSLSSPRLDDVRLAFDGGRLEIGAVRTDATWLGAALAQAAETTLENVTFDIGGIIYRIPRLILSGASLPQAELMSLFDARSSEPVAPRLARLSAREVRIPEVRIEQAVGAARQVTVYRDVVARDIVNGRIASLTSAGATLEFTGDKTGPRGTTGQLSIGDLDLAYAAALYGQKAGPQAAETRTVYASFSLDNLDISDPEGAQIRIARMAGKDFRARPAAETWGEAMRLMGEAQDMEKASPSQRARLFGILADLFDSFEVGSTEATGIEVRDRKAKDPAIGRIARIAFTGGGANRMADARAEGLEIVSSNGTARIGTIAFTGFSFRETLQGLKGLGEQPLETLDAADLRRLVPTVGTMRLSGLDFDLPREATKAEKAEKPENIRFGIRDIEVTADKPINGIPTNLRMAVESVTFAVPPNAQEDGLKDLAAMGYGKLDLSFVTAASWNEPGNELVVREVSVRGADMGSAVLRGVLANVGKDVFNSDSAVAAVALMGATAKNLHLTIENKGLFERLVAQEARKQKKSPEDIRREYGMAAAVAVPAMLGSSASAKAVGQAVARFVAKPGRLTITATTKDPAGLGIADVAATPDPAALLDKIEISATTE